MKKIYILLLLFLFCIANISYAIQNQSSLFDLSSSEKSKITQKQDDRSAFSEKAPALSVLQPKSGSVGFPVQPKSLTTATSWDLQLSFPCAVLNGEAGVETDGNYIYVAKWNGDLFFRYSMDGTFLEQFTVAGTGNVRDLAYDGQYFYGANANTTVFKMDFTRGAETLVGTITSPVSVRAIAYNDDLDAFYANNWSDNITLFDRSGAIISSGACGTWNSYYGFAYDNVSEGGPYLWGFSQIGSGSVIVQMNAATFAETGVSLDVVADLGLTTDILAGGLFTSDKIVPGTFSIGGLVQNNTIFAYKLADISSDLVYDNDPEVCGAVVNYTISAPEKGSIVQTGGLPSGVVFPVGTTTNTFELTDSLGVESDTSFTVTVNDVEPPVISCRPDTTVYTSQPLKVYDNGAQSFVFRSTTHNFSFADPTPGGAIVTKVSVDMNVYFPYNSAVYALNVLSLNGNEIGQTAVGAPAGNKTYTLSKVNPVYVKNGTNIFSLSSWWNYVTFNSAVITIEYQMEDGCSQFVSITPPSASDNCSYTLINNINNTAALSGIFQGGTTTVLWTATDGAGNIATCEQDITVVDNINPLAVCQDVTVYLDETGNVDIAEDAVNNNSTDGCSSLTFDTDITHFTCSDIGETNTVVLTVSDATGNSSTCSSNVTVIDDIDLVAVCKDVTLFLDETGHATLTPEDVDGGSGDNCGLSSMAVNLTDFDCSDLGENTVILSVTDNSENTASCEAQVTVVDTQVPQIDTIPDVEVAVAAGVCETAIDYPHPYVYDNCEITLELLSGLGENGIFPVGTTTETWVAIDKWDNSDTLSFNVTVTAPNTAPTIGTISDVTVDEGSTPVTVDLTGISWGIDCNAQEVTVTAVSSNAGLVSVSVEYTEGETGSLELSITPEMTGEAEITGTVTDSEGATATATFKVMVTAVNHAPVLVTPIADQTVNASYVLKVPVPAEMFADADGDELQVEVMQAGGENLPEWGIFANDTLVFNPMIADTGCYHMVVKATDPEGIFATDTFQVCVEGYPVSAGDIAAGGFGVNMYPNPTRGEVTIGISSGFHNVELTVSDIAGRAVLRKQYTMVERITFDMSNKVSGMYLVTLDIDGERTVKKLVVDRK